MKQVFLILLVGLCGAFASAASSDDERALMGRALYQGNRAFSAGADATTLNLPAENIACASCHGATGAGAREGNVTVPPLRWSALVAPRAGLPAYASARAVLQAITAGRGRGGNALDAVMPRFALTSDEERALIAYLERVGTDADQPPGVDEKVVRLATILPLSGPGGVTGAALQAGLRDAFTRANEQGGIHGRRIEFFVRDSQTGVRARVQSLQGKVFALVGGLWNERAADAETALSAARMSHIASFVVRDQPPSLNGWSADLLAPQIKQEALLEQTLRDCERGPRLLVALRGAEPNAAVADESAMRHDQGWVAADAELSARLGAARTGCIGYALAQAKLVATVAPRGWSQTLVLPMPALLFDAQSAGAPQRLWYRLGVLAGRLSVELLSRAGRNLHERALLDQLSTLSDFELFDGIHVQFGRERRYGWDPQILQMASPETSRATAQKRITKGE